MIVYYSEVYRRCLDLWPNTELVRYFNTSQGSHDCLLFNRDTSVNTLNRSMLKGDDIFWAECQ